MYLMAAPAGKPKKAPPFSVRFTVPIRKRLDELSERTGDTVTDIVEDAVEHFMAQTTPPAGLGVDSGHVLLALLPEKQAALSRAAQAFGLDVAVFASALLSQIAERPTAEVLRLFVGNALEEVVDGPEEAPSRGDMVQARAMARFSGMSSLDDEGGDEEGTRAA